MMTGKPSHYLINRLASFEPLSTRYEKSFISPLSSHKFTQKAVFHQPTECKAKGAPFRDERCDFPLLYVFCCQLSCMKYFHI